MLRVLISPGPGVSAGRSGRKLIQKANVHLARLNWRMITQNRAAEKSKLSVKLFVLVIEYVDVFRQLTYPASAHLGGNYRVHFILSFTSTFLMLRRLVGLLGWVVILAFSASGQAGTIVRVSTSVGDYSIELLDESAPATVQNFLNYVRRGDYNATYLHRVPDDFVVQGGAYRFQPYVGPVDVPTDPPVINEFGASNIRGTVAMAKIDGDPDSATNQWFVNLSDNTSLDTSNGGFTVFGSVLGNGMAVLDTINGLPKISLGFKAQDAPFTTGVYNDPRDLVFMSVSFVERYSEAAHVFESNSGLLITSVNVNNDEDIVSLYLRQIPSSSGLQLQVDPRSVIARTSFTGIATYSASDNRLRIPSLEVNQNGQVMVLSNVLFELTDPDALIFTLDSTINKSSFTRSWL